MYRYPAGNTITPQTTPPTGFQRLMRNGIEATITARDIPGIPLPIRVLLPPIPCMTEPPFIISVTAILTAIPAQSDNQALTAETHQAAVSAAENKLFMKRRK